MPLWKTERKGPGEKTRLKSQVAIKINNEQTVWWNVDCTCVREVRDNWRNLVTKIMGFFFQLGWEIRQLVERLLAS